MRSDDVTGQMWAVIYNFLDWLNRLEAKEYSSFLPTLIALLAVFFGPLMAYRLGMRQLKLQAQIAVKQVETQAAIAKRQIGDSVSAKRQNWIDELRKDMAEFLTTNARLNELARPGVNLCEQEQRKHFEERAANSFRSHELAVRIRLRLNPEEEKHNKLVDLLRKLADVSKDPTPNETDDQKKEAIKAFHEARDQVISHMQILLKHEWERVKKGDV
jgi:hypothetical protein